MYVPGRAVKTSNQSALFFTSVNIWKKKGGFMEFLHPGGERGRSARGGLTAQS